MEEFLENINDSLPWIEIASIIGVWQLMAALRRYVQDYVSAKRTIMQKKTRLQTEVLEAEHETKIAKEKDKEKNLREAIVKINDNLKSLREKYNGINAGIFYFHNGMRSDFKNTSLRYEDCRDIKHSVSNQYQNIPVSSYMSFLKKIVSIQDVITVTKDDEENNIINQIVKSKGLRQLTLAPICVPYHIYIEKNDELKDGIFASLNPDVEKKLPKEDFVIIGVVYVSLDEESKEDNQLKTNIKIMTGNLQHLYVQDYRIFV